MSGSFFQKTLAISFTFMVIFNFSIALAFSGMSKIYPHCNSSLSVETDFLPADEGLTQLRLPFAIASAAVALGFKDKNGVANNCSGSFISDQGHILTASHCIENCATPSNDGKFSADKVKKCEVTINGKSTTANVVFMSRCSAYSLQEIYKLKSQHIKIPAMQAECATEADLAVILPDDIPLNFTCLSLKTTPANAYDRVFTIGFPNPTFRTGDSKNSISGVPNVSVGEVRYTNTCFSKGRTANFLQRLKHAWEHTSEKDIAPGHKDILNSAQAFGPQYLQTTVDIVNGSSGGPLIDENGEITGVASFILAQQSNTVECRGATFFERTDSIAQVAKQWQDGLDIGKIKCEQKNSMHSQK